ncbi:MAG: helix-turn-helix domain-containing protein [Capnocytophaga sp.]|nr:helix-turn-helix domain-containing protein [Capnocytophaga sp.]
MANPSPTKHLEKISQLYQWLPKDHLQHPLVAVIDFSKYQEPFPEHQVFTFGFYALLFKNHCTNKMKYGQQSCDFESGNLICIAPNQQVSSGEANVSLAEEVSGWGLFFHPDLLKGTSLSRGMRDYTFFDYEINESLHLSQKEKNRLAEIVAQIAGELSENIDKHSQRLIVSNIELLLNYCTRYYDRQFITRRATHSDTLAKVEEVLDTYFADPKRSEKGLPSVKYLANEVCLSPNYLSDLLKKETGMNAQDHIHAHLIKEAQYLLSTTNKSVSELAFELGFEYPQYFSRLFKQKTGITPNAFRASGQASC